MSRKIIYLLNPKSGTQKKEAIKVLVEKETKRLEIPYEIYTPMQKAIMVL